MNRRQILQTAGHGFLAAGLAPVFGPLLRASSGNASGKRLFFNPEELPVIHANSATPLLRPLFEEWKAVSQTELAAALAKHRETGDIIRAFAGLLNHLSNLALVQLVEPTSTREKTLLDAVRYVMDAPHWDYFRNADNAVLGIQRASLTTVRLLWVREVLGDAIPTAMDRELLKAVAEKGCMACLNTLRDMDSWQEGGHGWRMDERHSFYMDIEMDRWPMILGANNLRADPTAALGIGALALRGIDPRAEAWLETVKASTLRVLDLFQRDGSFFEGISYANYTLRTLFNFFDAYERQGGNIRWARGLNPAGYLDYFVSMQLGKKPDGTPDVVNFSDAGGSFYPSTAAWIGRYAEPGLAQWAIRNASEPRIFLDFLWYRPEQPTLKAPPPRLLNVRNDLDWIICRSGWEPDDSVLAFRSGGPANHEHADRNTFMFKAFGERLLHDPFGAAYDWRQDGWALRLTRGHNGVLINGKGQQFHKGEEGTNDSKSYSTILNFQDAGDVVWWTSDATAAYIPDNYHCERVIRTVVFFKPCTFAVYDRIQLRYHPQPVELRYFPYNHDDRGSVRVSGEGDSFEVLRPRASLHGFIVSENAITTTPAALDVSAETGSFPYLSVNSAPALRHEILSFMQVRTTPENGMQSGMLAVREQDGFRLTVGSRSWFLGTRSLEPDLIRL